MEKILFITNQLFIDESKKEGGVRLCTMDFIRLLQCRYEVIFFPLQFNRSLLFRVKAKMGLDVFEDYDEKDYATILFNSIRNNGIKKVFINLSSTSAVSGIIKKEFKDGVKIILCSHGFESGDFLHHSVRFKNLMPAMARRTAPWRLGKILQKELEYRINYFDLILTVSEVEKAIEHWLGARQVIFVPRIFNPKFIEWNPIPGRVGFIGDISHYPNYYGLLLLCEAIAKKISTQKIEVRVVGSPCANLDRLSAKYPFITSVGYLDNKELVKEAGTWMYFLNLVFYYSKGVSTKLAKGMDWGLPVISTEAGNRGYIFKEGGVINCSDADEMVAVIHEKAFDKNKAQKDKDNILTAVNSFKDYNIVMDEIYPVLEKL